MSNVTISGQSQGGTQLGLATVTSDLSTAATSLADAAGLATTVTVGARPVCVIFECGLVSNSAATGFTHLAILRGSTSIKEGYVKILTAGGGTSVVLQVVDAPAAGSYTYKVQYSAITAGTSTLSGSVGLISSISVVER